MFTRDKYDYQYWKSVAGYSHMIGYGLAIYTIIWSRLGLKRLDKPKSMVIEPWKMKVWTLETELEPHAWVCRKMLDATQSVTFFDRNMVMNHETIGGIRCSDRLVSMCRIYTQKHGCDVARETICCWQFSGGRLTVNCLDLLEFWKHDNLNTEGLT